MGGNRKKMGRPNMAVDQLIEEYPDMHVRVSLRVAVAARKFLVLSPAAAILALRGGGPCIFKSSTFFFVV
jgi:hypothetical protein